MSSIELYKRSLKVVHPIGSNKPEPPDRTQTKIDHFSKKSRRRLQFVSINNSDVLISQFALTYHDRLPADGKECKKHLNTFLTWLKRNYPEVRYLWILEFQSRGAPHYHLFFNVKPDRTMQYKMALHWNKVTRSGYQHLEFHNHKNNFIDWDMGSGSYLTKYLDKTSQKFVPENYSNVGRFWGHSRELKPQATVIDADELDELVKIDYATGEFYGGKTTVLRWLGKYQKKKTNGFTYVHKMIHSFSCIMMDGMSAYKQIENYFYDINYVDTSKGFLLWSKKFSITST